jgi:phage-related minor tail protein
MASQNIARLGVVLGLDTAEFTASIDKAISENAKLKNAIRRDTNSAAGELKTLIHATEDYGKALTKVQLIQRETTSGRFMNATDDMKKKLLDQAAAYDKVANVAKSAADAASKLAAQQSLVQKDSNAGLADITALRNATEDYGRTLTRVELIQREISSGKYANATQEIKNQLLQQAVAYDKVALAAKNAADTQQKLNEQQNAVKRDSSAAATEINNLKNATEDYGKTLTKVELTQREITSGRFMNATQQMKTQLLQQAAAYDKVALSSKNAAGATFKMNEQQKINLTYQTTDFFTQIASGQSPFIAAIQQGGQLKDAMGGVGNMFKAIGSLFTPFSVGLGTVAASFGAVAYAIYEADQEFDKFQNSLTLTGNYAGVTAKELVAMSTAVAGTANTTIGKATEALDALVASSKFTKISLESVTNAVLTYAKIAGVDGKEAAEKLMSGLDGTASGARQLNDKMNFLTLAQYKQIEALDKAGKKQEAAKLAADILTGRLEAQKRILGETEGAWDKATMALSGYWNTFKKALFSGESPEDKLERMNDQIKVLQTGLRNATGDEPFFVGKTKELEALIKRRDEFADLLSERDQSIVAPDQKGKISNDATYGEMLKAKNIEVEKAISAAAFAEAKTRLDEIGRISREALQKIENSRLEMNEKNRKEEFRAASQNLSIFLNNEKVINAEAAEKIKQIRIKKYMEEQEAKVAYQKELDDDFVRRSQARISADVNAYNQTEELKFQRDSLDLKYQLIYATETEQKLAKISLEYARKRQELERNENNSDYQREQLDRQEAIARIMVTTEEAGKRTQQVFDTVWGAMGQAIDNFVKTGKLSMKDFARSTIQSLIAIEMKMQALTLLRGLFSSFSVGATPYQPAAVMGMPGYANGGEPTVGRPSIVGENGPEIFVPKTAGTIIPNNQISNMGSTTNVTNNYINAIDTKSFEDRLLGSSNAIWAANAYANKNLATNFGRT